MPWFRTEIRFTEEPPTDKQLLDLNGLCQQVDGDIPKLVEQGLLGDWRHPMLTLQALLNAIHILGYPCRGRWAHAPWEKEDEDIDAELAEQAWLYSVKDLSDIDDPRDIRTLRRFSRRFRRYLPPLPEEVRKGGRGRRGAKRRLQTWTR